MRIHASRLLSGYLVLLHILLILLVARSDFMYPIREWLGLTEDATQLSYYRDSLGFQRRVDANTPAGSILFFGDSLFAGLATGSLPYATANFGIGGDTLPGLADRMAHYQSVKSARLIVVCIGHNDLTQGEPPEPQPAFLRMLEHIPRSIPVLLSTVPPVDEAFVRNGSSNDRIRRFNETVDDIAESDNRVHLLDSHSTLSDGSNALPVEWHLGDGVHLSPSGNAKWLSGIDAAIGRLIE